MDVDSSAQGGWIRDFAFGWAQDCGSFGGGSLESMLIVGLRVWNLRPLQDFRSTVSGSAVSSGPVLDWLNGCRAHINLCRRFEAHACWRTFKDWKEVIEAKGCKGTKPYTLNGSFHDICYYP